MQPIEDRTRQAVRATIVSSELAPDERPEFRLGLIAALSLWIAILLAITLLFV